MTKINKYIDDNGNYKFCIRCGACCEQMNGIKKIYGRCDELFYDKNGKAVCGIQDNKPDVCRNYPPGKMICVREQNNNK